MSHLINPLQIPVSSENIQGLTRLSSDVEAQNMNETTKAITPANVSSLIASTSDVQTGTSDNLLPSVAALKSHLGTAKAWACFDSDNGVLNIRDSYGIDSIDDNGTGDFTFNFTTDFADTGYIYVPNSCVIRDEGTSRYRASLVSTSTSSPNAYLLKTTSSMTLNLYNDIGGLNDDFDINVSFFGRQ